MSHQDVGSISLLDAQHAVEIWEVWPAVTHNTLLSVGLHFVEKKMKDDRMGKDTKS